jgi:hypothetical protein
VPFFAVLASIVKERAFSQCYLLDNHQSTLYISCRRTSSTKAQRLHASAVRKNDSRTLTSEVGHEIPHPSKRSSGVAPAPGFVFARCVMLLLDEALFCSSTRTGNPFGSRREGKILIMPLIFGDESADETEQRTFAVSGLIASPDDWASFTHAWSSRTGGKIFHAADCESDAGDFKVTPTNTHADNLNLYKDLTQILAKNKIRGYAAAFDVASWRETFPAVPRDVGYYKCLTEVLKHFLYTPDYHDGTEMEFSFDHRKESEYNAGLLYTYLIAVPEWKEKNLFLGARISFASRRDVRIQAADLVAREAMKLLDDHGKRPMRKSLLALAKVPGAPFKFDCFGRDYCLDARRKWGEAEKVTGMTPAAYFCFLNEHRLADNWSNRFRFVNYLNLRDAENGKTAGANGGREPK